MYKIAQFPRGANSLPLETEAGQHLNPQLSNKAVFIFIWRPEFLSWTRPHSIKVK